MSSPRTDMETQRRRHWGPLFGLLAVVAFVIGLFVFYLTYEAAEGEGPNDQEGRPQEYVPPTETVDPGAPAVNP